MPDSNIAYSPDDWMHRTFNWELVRGFGQSKLGAASIAMPFIGFALLYHSELSNFLGGLGSEIGVQNESKASGDKPILSLNMKLNFIYLGLFCIGVGSMIYRLIAPKIIKEFSSISKFTESEISRTTARKMRSMMMTIKSKRPEIVKGLVSRAAWLDRSDCTLKSATNELRSLKDDQLQNDVLSSFYNVENRYTSRKMLGLIVCLYLVGFALLSIPGLVFTFRVLRVIFWG